MFLFLGYEQKNRWMTLVIKISVDSKDINGESNKTVDENLISVLNTLRRSSMKKEDHMLININCPTYNSMCRYTWQSNYLPL